MHQAEPGEALELLDVQLAGREEGSQRAEGGRRGKKGEKGQQRGEGAAGGRRGSRTNYKNPSRPSHQRQLYFPRETTGKVDYDIFGKYLVTQYTAWFQI